MVSAELSHNPYLLETKALFNGHGPQVNSAIHKYSHEPLVDWADEVPYIYHNEMNGFEFDLYFSGTDADFACVLSGTLGVHPCYHTPLIYRNRRYML